MIDRRGILLLAAALGAVAFPAAATAAADKTPIEVVALPSASSPLVAIQLRFDVGSIHDPAGKEGLASLTAMMIGQAGDAEALVHRPRRGALSAGGRRQHRHRPRGDGDRRHGPPRQAGRVHRPPRGGAAQARLRQGRLRAQQGPALGRRSPARCAATTSCSASRCSSSGSSTGTPTATPPPAPSKGSSTSPSTT